MSRQKRCVISNTHILLSLSNILFKIFPSNKVVAYYLESEYDMTFNENKTSEGNEMLNEELGFKVVIPDLCVKDPSVGSRRLHIDNDQASGSGFI